MEIVDTFLGIICGDQPAAVLNGLFIAGDIISWLYVVGSCPVKLRNIHHRLFERSEQAYAAGIIIVIPCGRGKHHPHRIQAMQLIAVIILFIDVYNVNCLCARIPKFYLGGAIFKTIPIPLFIKHKVFCDFPLKV